MNRTVVEDAAADLEVGQGRQWRVSAGRLDQLDMADVARPDLPLDLAERRVEPAIERTEQRFPNLDTLPIKTYIPYLFD